MYVVVDILDVDVAANYSAAAVAVVLVLHTVNTPKGHLKHTLFLQ